MAGTTFVKCVAQAQFVGSAKRSRFRDANRRAIAEMPRAGSNRIAGSAQRQLDIFGEALTFSRRASSSAMFSRAYGRLGFLSASI
jgi:hypothetical protein